MKKWDGHKLDKNYIERIQVLLQLLEHELRGPPGNACADGRSPPDARRADFGALPAPHGNEWKVH